MLHTCRRTHNTGQACLCDAPLHTPLTHCTAPSPPRQQGPCYPLPALQLALVAALCSSGGTAEGSQGNRSKGNGRRRKCFEGSVLFGETMLARKGNPPSGDPISKRAKLRTRTYAWRARTGRANTQDAPSTAAPRFALATTSKETKHYECPAAKSSDL